MLEFRGLPESLLAVMSAQRLRGCAFQCWDSPLLNGPNGYRLESLASVGFPQTIVEQPA